MRIIYNKILPTKGFIAINLFGIIFVKKGKILSDEMRNHEVIHSAQMKEMAYLIFYVFYLAEWIIKLFVYGKAAYYNISFEREAYQNAVNKNYLKERKPYAFLHYVLKNN